ncbi:MAG: hypothetical protein ACE5HS_04805 [bacterium]
MRTIRISNEVWMAIAERGKFGETPDDVLRRVFNIKPVEKANMRPRKSAAHRMTATVEDGRLLVTFSNGAAKTWSLPFKENKRELRVVREKAVAFAERNGATDGQLKALFKAMNNAGYYLTK